MGNAQKSDFYTVLENLQKFTLQSLENQAHGYKLYLKKNKSVGWRVGSAVAEDTGFAHSPLLTPVPGDLTSSSNLKGPQGWHVLHIYTCLCNTHKTINNQFIWVCLCVCPSDIYPEIGRLVFVGHQVTKL